MKLKHIELKVKEFEIKLKDGNSALIVDYPPEAIKNIQECGPQDGEFVLEVRQGEKDFLVDVKDILI